MSREIRITIDDDEVFERLKHRKDELDLSWEEVLRRGLKRDPGHGRRSRHAGRHGSHGHHPGPHHSSHRGPHHGPRDHHSHRDRGPESSWEAEYEVEGMNPFDPDFGKNLKNQIMGSLRESFNPLAEEFGFEATLDAEIDQLEDAEDAVLSMDFLGDDPTHKVPLRVNLRTTAGGLDVEVVAVRRGKGTAEMNQFADADRKQITKELAGGGTAKLELQGGAESYSVTPILTWARDEMGYPTVVEVEVDTVKLDD